MTHVSVNFDRTAFARDANVVFPLDRLNEMAQVGPTDSKLIKKTAFLNEFIRLRTLKFSASLEDVA
jgi:hypothetical protein